ncbi:MAG: hypothetical protein ACJ8CB_21380 [Ktedonobacteraceae bacterium]
MDISLVGRRDQIYRVPRAGRRGNVTPRPVGRDKSGPYDLLAALVTPSVDAY